MAKFFYQKISAKLANSAILLLLFICTQWVQSGYDISRYISRYGNIIFVNVNRVGVRMTSCVEQFLNFIRSFTLDSLIVNHQDTQNKILYQRRSNKS
jgi:hypothetical protein